MWSPEGSFFKNFSSNQDSSQGGCRYEGINVLYGSGCSLQSLSDAALTHCFLRHLFCRVTFQLCTSFLTSYQMVVLQQNWAQDVKEHTCVTVHATTVPADEMYIYINVHSPWVPSSQCLRIQLNRFIFSSSTATRSELHWMGRNIKYNMFTQYQLSVT